MRRHIFSILLGDYYALNVIVCYSGAPWGWGGGGGAPNKRGVETLGKSL